MPGNIVTGIGPTGQPQRVRATADGELLTASEVDDTGDGRDDTPSWAAETNRLLRKLIAGLEQYLGSEFPEVE